LLFNFVQVNFVYEFNLLRTNSQLIKFLFEDFLIKNSKREFIRVALFYLKINKMSNKEIKLNAFYLLAITSNQNA